MTREAYAGYDRDRMQYRDGYAVITAHGCLVQTCVLGLEVKTPYAHLMSDGHLAIHAGYACDGATGVPDWRWIRRGAVVHDVLAQMLRGGVLPRAFLPAVQETLRQLCMADGCPQILANVIRWAVTRTQGSYTRPSAERVVKVAP